MMAVITTVTRDILTGAGTTTGIILTGLILTGYDTIGSSITTGSMATKNTTAVIIAAVKSEKERLFQKYFFAGETASREEKANCKRMFSVLPPSRLFCLQDLLRLLFLILSGFIYHNPGS